MTGPTPVFARPCTNRLSTQKWMFTRNGQIKTLNPSDNRCLSVLGCANLGSQSGQLILSTCTGAPSQVWTFRGAAENITAVQAADGGCWERNGCNGPSIDTNYGCKSLPSQL